MRPAPDLDQPARRILEEGVISQPKLSEYDFPVHGKPPDDLCIEASIRGSRAMAPS